MTEENQDVIVEFFYKYWNKLDHTILMVHHELELNYDERKQEFMNGINLNLEQVVTDEKWSNYIVGRVYKNRRKNYYEECMYWFLIHVYLVDRTTTKNSLYNLAFKDISELRFLSKSQN